MIERPQGTYETEGCAAKNTARISFSRVKSGKSRSKYEGALRHGLRRGRIDFSVGAGVGLSFIAPCCRSLLVPVKIVTTHHAHPLDENRLKHLQGRKEKLH